MRRYQVWILGLSPSWCAGRFSNLGKALALARRWGFKAYVWDTEGKRIVAEEEAAQTRLLEVLL